MAYPSRSHHSPRSLAWLAALLVAGGLGSGLAQAQAMPAQALPTQPAQAVPLPTTSTPATSTPATSTPPTSTPAAPSVPAPSLSDLLTWLRDSPGWKAADLSYHAAELQLQSARARAGLSLSVGGNVAVAKIPWDSGQWVNTSSLMASLGLSVLPWSPALEAVRSAERAQRVAATELRRTRADLTSQALQAYAGAAQAAAAASLGAAQLDLAGQSLAVAEQQRQVGMLPPEAVLERRAALEQAQAGNEQARRALTLSAGQLTRLLGRVVTLPAERSAYSSLSFDLSTPDLAALTDKALAQRPEIARAQAAVLDAQAALATAQRNAALPDITAAAQLGQVGTSDATSGKRVSASFNLKGGTVGAQATVPLSDTSKLPSGVALSLSGNFPLLGRTEGLATEQARVGVQQAELALTDARQAVTLDVSSHLDDYLNEQQGVTALQTLLTRAQTVLEATRARQQAGLATTIEVHQAELNVQQAQDNLRASRDRLALATLGVWQATADLDAYLLATQPTLPTLPGGQP